MYCNGLMDHLCPCPNGSQSVKLQQEVHYKGMIVSDALKANVGLQRISLFTFIH